MPENDNIFTVPVGFGACRWLSGTCGQCFVETAAAVTVTADAVDAAAAGVSVEPLGEPRRM